MTHRALVTAGIGRDAFERDGVDDGVIAGAGEERGKSLFLAESREDLRAGHRERGLHRSRLGGLGELAGNFDRLVFCRVSGARLVFPKGDNRGRPGAGHRFGYKPSSGDVRSRLFSPVFIVGFIHSLSWLTFVALVDGWMNRQPARRHKSHKKKKTQGGSYSAL